VTGSYRGTAAAFDAIAMVAAAYVLTRGSFGDPAANVALWGSAAAAVIAGLVVLTNGPAAIGWAAVGYMLFAALVSVQAPPVLLAGAATPRAALLLLLAVAYLPILHRPRGSLGLGIAVAVATAVVLRVAVERVA
jgi:hypothetical protein